jgi:uncharacterized protein (TIGR03083 family)
VSGPIVALPDSVRLSEHACAQFIAAIAAAPDPGRLVQNSEWTVHDVASHVDIVARAYVRYLQGDVTPVVDPYDLSKSNALRLAEEPVESIDVVLTRLRGEAEELFRLMASRSAGDTVVWHGERLSASSVIGIFLGELLFHGEDVARTIGRRWTISPDEARTVLHGVFDIAPIFVNPATAQGVTAAYDVRVRGGRQYLLRFRDGDLVVDPDDDVRPDCHVSANPLALLRVLYGRSNQWTEIARGRMFASGRKPWLAFGLKKLFKNP